MTEKISTINPDLDPETWVDQYGDYLYRFALTRIKDPFVAEDLVQETFLAALNGRESFKSRSTFQTWLTGILKYKILDFFRKKNREQAVDDIDMVDKTVDGFYHGDGSWKIRPGKWDLNPSKTYEQNEFLNAFFKCLAKLPDRLARIFMHREVEGLDTEELCKAFQISATNSWVMLYRARMHLRRCLELSWFNKVEEENR